MQSPANRTPDRIVRSLAALHSSRRAIARSRELISDTQLIVRRHLDLRTLGIARTDCMPTNEQLAEWIERVEAAAHQRIVDEEVGKSAKHFERGQAEQANPIGAATACTSPAVIAMR